MEQLKKLVLLKTDFNPNSIPNKKKNPHSPVVRELVTTSVSSKIEM